MASTYDSAIKPKPQDNAGELSVHRDDRCALSSAEPESDFDPPVATRDNRVFIWDEDGLPVDNYSALGDRLAQSGDLFRRSSHGGGLILASNNALVPVEYITDGKCLARRLSERVRVSVIKNGKPHGSTIPAAQLAIMIGSEVFLQRFASVDEVTTTPLYLPNWALTQPGYNDGGRGFRIFHRGETPVISDRTDVIDAFLDAMAFATLADRTNTIAAALTVLLHNFFPGGKPAIVVTADKSHAGKNTVVAFATGRAKAAAISYQREDWAVERSAVGAFAQCPETVVLHVDNARIYGGQTSIASAFVERFLTDPEPMLFATGTGKPRRIRNDKVIAITTNAGSLSTDLMNRALTIHLAPKGDVCDRHSAIGNPKEEYLPAHKTEIESELHGYVARWVAAGCPLIKDAPHPFSNWAEIVGGILRVNGCEGFLANYKGQRTTIDPVRNAVGMLGAGRPDEWLKASEWERIAACLGLVNAIVTPDNRGSAKLRVSAIGKLLSSLEKETFDMCTEDERVRCVLERKRRRFDGELPQVRYRFVTLNREELPVDE